MPGLANPLLSQIPQFSPFAAGAGIQGIPSPYGFAAPFGLSHTAPEGVETAGRPTWADPVLASRIAQTFPYAGFAYPPVIALF